MDIDNPVGEGIDQEVWNQRQPTCQNDEADVVLTQQGQHHIWIMQISLRGNSRRHTEPFGPIQNEGVCLITDNESAVHALGVSKVFDQVLAVGTAA